MGEVWQWSLSQGGGVPFDAPAVKAGISRPR